MSAVLTAVALGSALPEAAAELDRVTTAIWVNCGICVPAAGALALFLRGRAKTA